MTKPSTVEFEASPAFAGKMDTTDPLKCFREKFHIPQTSGGGEIIYFTGNSLGLQPKTTREYVDQELSDWAALGVQGHMHAQNPWLPYHEFLTERMARVIGAKPIETVVMNSLTVNLHLMMVTFYRPDGKRNKIVIEKGAFPSDQYAVGSQIAFHKPIPDRSVPPAVAGGSLHPKSEAPRNEEPPASAGTDRVVELTPREGESTLRTEDIIETIERHGDEIALVLLGGVNYYTGQAFDMKTITEAGHRVGAKVGFDLAHAAGNLLMQLHDWDVDFAVWCSYKYLNAGPGGVAGAFVHERHAKSFALPRFAGWWGHDKATRFLMGPNFVPLEGAEGWQISNPPILQMAALRASLEIFDVATMPALRAKSERLTGYLEFLVGQIDNDGISVITPSDPKQRGCQLSIRVKDADKKLFETMTTRGVSADWREPDVIRVAPVPLYNSFADVYSFVEILKRCLM
ncbi:MAG TPA: kynureninase [Pyrinomonadaceae bacterium]|nr:kynureninase [Pyrinomonadaceae bacterium]